MRLTALALVLLPLGMGSAHAGLFDDDEARRQLAEHQKRVEARFEQQARAQLDLAAQIQRQADDIAQLRGMLESAQHESVVLGKRQQDFYLDLDSRLRKLDAQLSAASASNGMPDASPAAAGAPQGSKTGSDAQRETADYDAALARFKAGKYKEASWSFAAFVKQYPSSTLAPNAQYWLGNAWYAQQDCKKAIEAQLVVTQRYADSAKAPDAWWIIATCQQELGDKGAERQSLETLVAKYPSAAQIADAKRRLAELSRPVSPTPKSKKKPDR